MRKLLKYILIISALFVVNFFVITVIDIDFKIMPKLNFSVSADREDIYQIFYSETTDGWKEEDSISVEYTKDGGVQSFSVGISEKTKFLRIDTGKGQSRNLTISDISLSRGADSVSIAMRDKEEFPMHDISLCAVSAENDVKIVVSGNDPFFVIDIKDINISSLDNPSEGYNIAVKAVFCVISSLFIILIGMRLRFVFEFFKALADSRKMILSLSKNDFKTKFSGSFFGVIWAFIQPVITVVVYWFVFQVGLRSGPVDDTPFVLWFVAGLIPWFFFSDALMGGTMSLFEYSYLVKKVVFKISIIPVVKIMSVLFIHLFFVAFTLILFTCYGYVPDKYAFQIIYYSFCLVVFTLGLCYATCAIVVFFKDLSQIVNIFLQIGMWFTPIMWNYKIISPPYQIFFKLNPLFYIVEGYRDSLIDKYWFWERINYSVYFWIITIGLFGFGAIIFRKLKVHFADIL